MRLYIETRIKVTEATTGQLVHFHLLPFVSWKRMMMEVLCWRLNISQELQLSNSLLIQTKLPSFQRLDLASKNFLQQVHNNGTAEAPLNLRHAHSLEDNSRKNYLKQTAKILLKALRALGSTTGLLIGRYRFVPTLSKKAVWRQTTQRPHLVIFITPMKTFWTMSKVTGRHSGTVTMMSHPVAYATISLSELRAYSGDDALIRGGKKLTPNKKKKLFARCSLDIWSTGKTVPSRVGKVKGQRGTPTRSLSNFKTSL